MLKDIVGSGAHALQKNQIAELLSKVLVDAVTVAASKAIPGIETVVDGEKLAHRLARPLDRGIDALAKWADSAPNRDTSVKGPYVRGQ